MLIIFSILCWLASGYLVVWTAWPVNLLGLVFLAIAVGTLYWMLAPRHWEDRF